MSSQDWSAILARNYAEATGAKRNVRLPSDRHIRVEGDVEGVTLSLSLTAVTANMQSDSAAFEAWALALKAWCGVRTIAVDWQAPPPADTPSWRHYQRFLYRAQRFATLFPDWFRIIPQEQLAVSRILRCDSLVLNVAGKTADLGSPAPNSEAALERHLLGSEVFRAAFGLTRLDRQFPVGLFDGTVVRGNEVFSGGKSAIDLIGLDGQRRLWLFELKAGRNEGLGIVSELLFYALVMQDAVRRRFAFAQPEAGNRAAIGPQDVLACERIEACFLAPNFHPLLAQDRITGLLSGAMAGGDIPVHFRMVRLADIGIIPVEPVS